MPSSVQHSLYQIFFVMIGGGKSSSMSDVSVCGGSSNIRDDSSTVRDDSSTVGVEVGGGKSDGTGGVRGTGGCRGTGGGYGGTNA